MASCGTEPPPFSIMARAKDHTVEISEVESRVKQAIVRVLQIDMDEINADSNFIFDLGADSQQSVELVAAFEEEFEMEMDEDAALGVQNVQDAVTFIAGIVNG
jgi:acyl carrier protein